MVHAVPPRARRHVNETLEEARTCHEGLRQASRFNDFDRRWRAWLSLAQRIWNKLEGAYHAHPKFVAIRDRHRNLEKTDPLLKYIKFARDTDEHSVREVTEVSHALLINPIPGSGGVSLSWTKRGDVRTLDVRSPVEIRQETRVELLPVENRRVKVEPPREHLGTPVVPLTALRVAELAMVYFEDLVASTERDCT